MVSLGSNRVTAQKKALSPTPNTVSILASQLRNTLLLLHVTKKIAVIQKPLQNNQMPRVNRPDWKKWIQPENRRKQEEG